MRIAICDDERTYIKKIENDINSLKTHENEFEFSEFESGEAFISGFSKDKYDLIILDIEMNDLNGLQTAEFLRQIDKNVILIFMTSYDKFVYQGYEVNAFRYILKNQPEPIYLKQLSDTIQEYYRNKKYIKVVDNDIEKELLTVDILYIEVYSHQIVIHTFNKEYYQKGKLSDYEKMLEECLFVRSDKSVLINITNIDYIKKNQVFMKNGKILYVSRNHLEKITKAFLKFSRNRWG
ncbi:LytR/AlgR family response regulator transcription factor [Ruminococcus sp. RTP21204st1_B2_RTP21204_210225]|uniref:LytR/AlgR family response regulator transcription factor n=1 Tax=Ruminococcus sp. RTP21204st1_B2_RTP21204_210225 TaxID=3141602 RepID=UPI0034A1D334